MISGARRASSDGRVRSPPSARLQVPATIGCALSINKQPNSRSRAGRLSRRRQPSSSEEKEHQRRRRECTLPLAVLPLPDSAVRLHSSILSDGPFDQRKPRSSSLRPSTSLEHVTKSLDVRNGGRKPDDSLRWTNLTSCTHGRFSRRPHLPRLQLRTRRSGVESYQFRGSRLLG